MLNFFSWFNFVVSVGTFFVFNIISYSLFSLLFSHGFLRLSFRTWCGIRKIMFHFFTGCSGQARAWQKKTYAKHSFCHIRTYFSFCHIQTLSENPVVLYLQCHIRAWHEYPVGIVSICHAWALSRASSLIMISSFLDPRVKPEGDREVNASRFVSAFITSGPSGQARAWQKKTYAMGIPYVIFGLYPSISWRYIYIVIFVLDTNIQSE